MTPAESFDRAQWLIVPVAIAGLSLVAYLLLIGA